MNDEPITEAQIKQFLVEGRLPNLFRWHHYKQIIGCAQIIEDCLTKLEKMGFSPFEVYYALRQHLFYARFAFEDGGMVKAMNTIDDEMLKDMIEHRKKYTKEAMRTGKYRKSRPEGSSEEITH